MKVLVTGANGMLGQDLCPVFEDNGLYVIPMGREDLDVTERIPMLIKRKMSPRKLLK